jgi:hypothetical protein
VPLSFSSAAHEGPEQILIRDKDYSWNEMKGWFAQNAFQIRTQDKCPSASEQEVFLFQ